MKDSYEKKIAMQCITCGSDSSFEINELTGIITCKKCNRVYNGGYNELKELNQTHINDELNLVENEIIDDIEKDINNIFDNINI